MQRLADWRRGAQIVGSLLISWPILILIKSIRIMVLNLLFSHNLSRHWQFFIGKGFWEMGLLNRLLENLLGRLVSGDILRSVVCEMATTYSSTRLIELNCLNKYFFWRPIFMGALNWHPILNLRIVAACLLMLRR